ncbi:MAG: NAD-dependent epimerase/dehydratase family protein [Desulfobacteraceae bacterium]|nr:MAG: NAD-dependent epimerase/dehydratase family protein [Desulfobacteraceae bacterium]
MNFSTSEILKEDYQEVWNHIQNKAAFSGARFLITGIAGFLGFNFAHALSRLSALGCEPASVIGLDNFMFGTPPWLKTLCEKFPFFRVSQFDIAKDDLQHLPGSEKVDYVIHLASIASPSFYRRYPIETLDANVWGLRKLLDFYKHRSIKSLLFFSSSEIYGDPFPEFIPTGEDYRGNVPCLGPRACYDEAKRFGETLCYLYHQTLQMPIKIVRPFNNFGPGMSINDKRVVADFAKAVMQGEDMVIHSDGTPTRTYCYIRDALTGYFSVLLSKEFDVFNIGIDKPEITVRELAAIYQNWGEQLFDYRGRICSQPSPDQNYLIHNPQRRCPDIAKAKTLLGYAPGIEVHEGVGRYLKFLREVTA